VPDTGWTIKPSPVRYSLTYAVTRLRVPRVASCISVLSCYAPGMSDYRRFFVPGGTFFFTVVTERRMPLFAKDNAREIFGSVLRDCQHRFAMEIVAIVLLPDHLHTLWTLPLGDANYAARWGWIKKEFSKAWLAQGGSEGPLSETRQAERRRAVWQRRFWEHTIRDESDLAAHFDYIHYTPVKHGWAASPRDWPWSSFHRWVQEGHYAPDWAAAQPATVLPGNAGE
jgi:putative transposase